MRLLVINTVMDPGTARLRARFPGKVLQRPTIAGQPLPPRGRRVMPVDLLLPAIVDQLEYLVSIGNIEVREFGSSRQSVDFAELRVRLGITPGPEGDAAAQAVAAEPPTPPADTSPAVPLGGAEGSVVSPEGDVTPEEEAPPPVEAFLDPVAEEHTDPKAPPVADNETFTLPLDIDELVRDAKNKVLGGVLALFEKPWLGKNKATLIEEVNECLSGDPDPVIANRAVALLRTEEV